MFQDHLFGVSRSTEVFATKILLQKQHTYGRDFKNFPRVHEGDDAFFQNPNS